MQDKKAGNRFALLLKDAGKAFLLGLAVAAGVFILLLAVGAVSHGFSALAGLELARRGLFIVGALALLVSAGALLLPEKAASVREKDGWTARFGRFGPRRAALRIFSGRKLYNFRLPERLRTLRQSIFTGGSSPI